MTAQRERMIAIHGALVVRLVDRMMQFRYERVMAAIDGTDDALGDGPEHLTRYAEATALTAIVQAAKFADLPMSYDTGHSHDAGAAERVYCLTEGHVLSAQDVRDIEAVLAELNDEIAYQADKWHAAREQALHDLGGAELVKLMNNLDDVRMKASVERAMARVRAELELLDEAKNVEIAP